MNHIMVDIETTGLLPHLHAIIQIAGVKFQPGIEGLQASFCRSLKMPAGTSWDIDTERWWNNSREKAKLLRRIESEATDCYEGLYDFCHWCGGDAVFWAKPSLFDFPFVDYYINKYGPKELNPFSFRRVIDVRSYAYGRGLGGSDWVKNIPFVGSEHDALDDALHQVKMVNYAAGLHG